MGRGFSNHWLQSINLIYLFYYGLTSIYDPMADTLISYNRENHVELVGLKLFLIHTSDDDIGHSVGKGAGDILWERTEIQFQRVMCL